MATRARLTITVTSSRNSSTVEIRSNGSYRGLTTNKEEKTITGLPLYGNATEEQFWTSVLGEVSTNV